MLSLNKRKGEAERERERGRRADASREEVEESDRTHTHTHSHLYIYEGKTSGLCRHPPPKKERKPVSWQRSQEEGTETKHVLKKARRSLSVQLSGFWGFPCGCASLSLC